MNQLQLFPSLQYSYPFTHIENFESDLFTGIIDGTGSCAIDLSRFANADLHTIIFYVVDEGYKLPAEGLAPQPYRCDAVSNILCTLNSNVVHNLSKQLYHLTNMLTGPLQGPAYTDYAVLESTQFTPNSYRCEPVYLTFTKNLAINEDSHLNNTWRLTNNKLKLMFNTTTVSPRYRLYASFYYNAVAQFKQGVSAIYIS